MLTFADQRCHALGQAVMGSRLLQPRDCAAMHVFLWHVYEALDMQIYCASISYTTYA